MGPSWSHIPLTTLAMGVKYSNWPGLDYAPPPQMKKVFSTQRKGQWIDKNKADIFSMVASLKDDPKQTLLLVFTSLHNLLLHCIMAGLYDQ